MAEKPNQRRLAELRREKVKILLTLGLTQLEMADKLGVHKETIFRDVKKIRKEWSQQVSSIDLNELVGQLRHEANLRKRRLYDTMQDKETKNEQGKTISSIPATPYVKISCLKAMREEDRQLVDLLQSVGKIYKAPENINLKASLSWKDFEESWKKLKEENARAD
jgi:hypothetical protein